MLNACANQFNSHRKSVSVQVTNNKEENYFERRNTYFTIRHNITVRRKENRNRSSGIISYSCDTTQFTGSYAKTDDPKTGN